jgi:hypothetical protein
MEIKEVSTYGDLLKVLQILSPEQLAQPAQVVKSHSVHEKVLAALPIICVGTVDSLGLLYIRSSKDNRRHGDEVILFLDSNPFGKNGAIAYEAIGADIFGECTPIFPKDYNREEQDWTVSGTAKKRVDETIQELPDGSLGPILRHRLDIAEKEDYYNR